jgi:F-type H+-transporting ATPase subunit b
MQISLWNLGLQTVNFLVLVFLLRRFLYQPVLAIIDERKQKVARELQVADQAKAEAAALRQQYQDKLESLEDEKQQILRAAQQQAESDAASLRKATESQLDELRSRQSSLLIREREEAERALTSHALNIGLKLAEKLLLDEAIVRDPLSSLQTVLRRLDALPLSERERLLSSLIQQGAELVSVQAVSDVERVELQTKLSSWAGQSIALATRIDPSLVVGVEWRVGYLSFALHLRAGLEKARAETLPR